VTLTFTASQVEALALAVSYYLDSIEADAAEDEHRVRGGRAVRRMFDPIEDRLLFAMAAGQWSGEVTG
jgi:hypothetical protein